MTGHSVSREAAERAWVQSSIMEKLTQLSDRMGAMESNMNKLLDRRGKSADFDLSLGIPGLDRGVSPSVISSAPSLSRKHTAPFKSPDYGTSFGRDPTAKFSDSWAAAVHAQYATEFAAKTPKSGGSGHSDRGV